MSPGDQKRATPRSPLLVSPFFGNSMLRWACSTVCPLSSNRSVRNCLEQIPHRPLGFRYQTVRHQIFVVVSAHDWHRPVNDFPLARHRHPETRDPRGFRHPKPCRVRLFPRKYFCFVPNPTDSSVRRETNQDRLPPEDCLKNAPAGIALNRHQDLQNFARFPGFLPVDHLVRRQRPLAHHHEFEPVPCRRVNSFAFDENSPNE